jgi:AcrR family transcriptional regulator
MASTDRATEPAKRGRPASLTESQIVAAALELSGAVPLEQVSMRALAAHLSVPVMTVYNYVPNKAALYELVQNRILAGVEVPPPDAGSWEERMRLLQRDARAAVAEHLGVQFGTGLGRSSEAARLADGVHDILATAGFEPDDVPLAFTTLFTFMLGQLEVDALSRSEDTSGEVDLQMPTGVAAPVGDEAFEYAFDVVLAGLRTKLHRERRGRAGR